MTTRIVRKEEESRVPFKDLQIGELFTTGRPGLFMKIEVIGQSQNTMVIEPSLDASFVSGGYSTSWPVDDKVIPVAQIEYTVKRENT